MYPGACLSNFQITSIETKEFITINVLVYIKSLSRWYLLSMDTKCCIQEETT